jgi:Fe-S-cluster containining protein
MHDPEQAAAARRDRFDRRRGARDGRAGLGAGESVESADRRLLADLQEAFDRVAARAGHRLACRPGCDDCCHGPFPITRLDARRLRVGMDWLAARDPEAAKRVVERARAAVARLAPGFPGDPTTGRPDPDVDRLDRFFEAHADLACPVLDPGTGRCDLYDHRPVACRIYGPPLRFGDNDAEPCRLCFDGAATEVVERCRLEPDVQGLEAAILDALGVEEHEPWETLIAFALSTRDAE